ALPCGHIHTIELHRRALACRSIVGCGNLIRSVCRECDGRRNAGRKNAVLHEKTLRLIDRQAPASARFPGFFASGPGLLNSTDAHPAGSAGTMSLSATPDTEFPGWRGASHDSVRRCVERGW